MWDSVLTWASKNVPTVLGAGAFLAVGLSGYLLMTFQGHDHHRYHGSTKPAKNPMKLLQWLAPTVAFTTAVIAYQVDPEPLRKVFPAFYSAYGGLNNVLPLHPKNMLEAFKLGSLVQQVQSPGANTSAILTEAGRIVGRTAPVLLEQLLGLEKEIALLQDQQGLVSKVVGLFSFINIMWGIGISLITVATAPVLYILGRPIMEFLAKFFTDIIVPILIALIPAYPYMVNTLAMWFIVEGSRYPVDAYSATGLMMALTGVMIAAVNYGYCTAAYAPKSGGGEQAFFELTSGLLTAILIPLAIAFQSKFFGLLAAFSVVTFFGFSFVAMGWGYCVGFQNDAMIRCSLACLASNLALVIVRSLHLRPEWLLPFEGAMASVGGSVYFLSLLIFSSWYYDYRQRTTYIVRQIPMVASLLAYYYLGSFYGIPAMVNVAHVYAVLYGSEKYLDAGPACSKGGAIWFYVMGAGGILYGVALYLNRHPELVVGMLSGV